jgi:DNA replication and repair protein RecF
MLSNCLVTGIILQNFRNYAFRQFEFSSKLNFFVGRNGAGKTNLLEALSMLGISGGFRGAEMRDLNRNQLVSFSLGFETKYGQIGVKNVNGTKRFTIEDEPCKFGELEGKFKTLALSPEDEFVFRASVSGRRAFFDALLGKLNAEHEAILKEYKALCVQRSKILSEFAGQDAWLETLEKQLAQKLVVICTNRVLLSERLSEGMKSLSEIGLRGEIRLTGYLEGREFSASSEEKIIREMLYSSRNIDAITGKTLTKMERTNFDVLFSEKNIFASRASSGEQKKMLFSAILSVCKLINCEILLIDEVASKFDERGRDMVFSELSSLNSQVFASGTEGFANSAVSFIEI